MTKIKANKSSAKPKPKVNLNQQLDNLRQELIQIHQQLRQGTSQNTRLPRITRKKIARTLTEIHQKPQAKPRLQKETKDV